LVTDGQVGAPPTWYRVVKAARYLGMSPPEVARMPLFWVEAAEAAQDAEATAEAERRKRLPGTG
jgi:hypothetical protein